MINSRMRDNVHRWSAQPCAVGPRSSSVSNRTNWSSSSRHRAAGPRERKAGPPPDTHARRHRSIDRSVTRNVAAT